jgi:putative solute:sodium symporter small subunit
MSSHWRSNRRLTVALLLLWAAVSFGVPYFAQHLRFMWFGAPFSFWLTAQGTLVVYFFIVACYGVVMNRLDSRRDTQARPEQASSTEPQAPC